MPRSRQIGITDEMKWKILHWERVPKDRRKDVAYDVRQIIMKELDDLHWIVTNARDDFRRTQDRTFTYPLEPILPQDPQQPGKPMAQQIGKAMEFLDDMEEAIQFIRTSVKMWGLKYTRTGRY